MHCRASFRSVLYTIAVMHCGLMSAQAHSDTPPVPDVRLVIDVSGSMKRNDPNNLRQPAVELLMQLLPQGSKAGVWTFGKFVNMLVPHKQVDDQWRATARKKASEINSLGLFTNIGEALERAAADAASEPSGHRPSIILLTDGMVDIAKSPEKNKAEWRRVVDEVLPKLKSAGFTVHTIALSKNADKDLMQKLSLSTDGIASVAENADDLLKIFLQAFDTAVPSEKVPLVDNSFLVDSSVEEFTALIFRNASDPAIKLFGPDQELITRRDVPEDVKWHHTDKYDLITVTQPLEGEWKVSGSSDPDNRVTVVSDLTLRVKKLPSNVYLGASETLQFALQEDGVTVTRPDFLGLLTNTVSLGFGAGQIPTQQKWQYQFGPESQPEQGVYQKQLPAFEDVGVYDIQVSVDGKTFKREYLHRLSVREPFSAQIDETADDRGEPSYRLTVRAHGQDIVLKKVQIAATVINPKRRKTLKALSLTEYDNWQAQLRFDEVGVYVIETQVSGVDAKAKAFEYLLSPIRFDYQPDGMFGDDPLDAAAQPPATELEPAAKPAPGESDADPEEIDPDDSTLPQWALYTLLGLGNLLLILGGFLVFRKLMSDGSESGPEPETAVPEPARGDEVEAAEAEPPAQVDEPMPEVDLSMDDGTSSDEAPPMEALASGELDTPGRLPESVDSTQPIESAEQNDADLPAMEDLTDADKPGAVEPDASLADGSDADVTGKDGAEATTDGSDTGDDGERDPKKP